MITATHRIITDQCRERPAEDIVAETLASVKYAIRGALNGWPVGDGTEIHVKVEIKRLLDEKPTIHDLETLMDADDVAVEIHPDGSTSTRMAYEK